MRLRKLETSAGTVLVMDKLDAEDVHAARAAWDDREDRPFVLGFEGEVEIPELDRMYAPAQPAPWPYPLGPSQFSPGGV